MYQSKKPYLYGTGRRKSSVARVHLFPNGTGTITINGGNVTATGYNGGAGIGGGYGGSGGNITINEGNVAAFGNNGGAGIGGGSPEQSPGGAGGGGGWFGGGGGAVSCQEMAARGEVGRGWASAQSA